MDLSLKECLGIAVAIVSASFVIKAFVDFGLIQVIARIVEGVI